jgi:hypothetical protein
LIVQESKHQEDQGWKAIQGNSLPNSISKIPEKTTWCSVWKIRMPA